MAENKPVPWSPSRPGGCPGPEDMLTVEVKGVFPRQSCLSPGPLVILLGWGLLSSLRVLVPVYSGFLR